MIHVAGSTGTEEYLYACRLRDLFAAAWPGSLTDKWLIHIIANVKCVGQPVADVDIVVFIPYFPPVKRMVAGQKRVWEFHQLCLAIEVKSHSPERISFIGNQVQVHYAGKKVPSNVSDQSHNQGISVSRHLAGEGYRKCWVCNVIWLVNCPAQLLPRQCHNIVGSDSTWDSFLQVIISSCTDRHHQNLNDGHWKISHSGMRAEAFQQAAGGLRQRDAAVQD